MNSRFSNSSFVFLISWLLYFFHFTIFCNGEETCSLDDVFNNNCGEHALCLQNKNNIGICQCENSYKLENGKCVRISLPSTDAATYNDHPDVISGGSSVALWILVPCFILVLAGAIFFMIKRLKLVEKLYQFRVRRYNTVFVTSLQDDDAPIS